MAIIHILPTSCTADGDSYYYTLTNPENALTPVDSDTYCEFGYLRDGYSGRLDFKGFDFSLIPDGIIIDSIKPKIKVRASRYPSASDPCYLGYSFRSNFDGTWRNYYSYMANGNVLAKYTVDTYDLGSQVKYISTGTAVDLTKDILQTCTNFEVDVSVSSASDVVRYAYVYGVEVEVEYHEPYKIFNLILPGKANYPEPVPPTQEYTISKYPASYTTSGSISGTRYQNAIGKGADTAAVSGNDYASSSGSTAYINYAFDFSEIPDTATIKSMTLQAKGHCESTSSSSEKAELQVYSGNTAKSAAISFTSTSAQTLSINFTGYTMTVAELKAAVLRFTIGYYGGLVNGATWTVTYEA